MSIKRFNPNIVATESLRADWSRAEAEALYALPFADLIFQAQSVQRNNFDPNHVETASLLSIKTGGCPEDCGYCWQSAHYDTGLKATRLVDRAAMQRAKDAGATRFCMNGAAARLARPKLELSGSALCWMIAKIASCQLERPRGRLKPRWWRPMHD